MYNGIQEPQFRDEEEAAEKIEELDGLLEPDVLLKWSSMLDYDSYHSEWMALATSARTEGTC